MINAIEKGWLEIDCENEIHHIEIELIQKKVIRKYIRNEIDYFKKCAER